MIVASKQSDVGAPAGSSIGPRVSRHATAVLLQLLMAALFIVNSPSGSPATAATQTPPPMEERVRALIPGLEAYIASGMKAFDVPGLAIGIVAGDTLVYAKGFGVRSKGGGVPVDTRTIFQIGSTTKAFLATTLAIMVDRRKLRWDDRIVDLDADFQLKDPWVTREFRVFDLLAQRSGLPPYANDMLGMLVGLDEAVLIRSLRHVEPVSSFRSTFAYTNITHLLAGRIVAKAAGAADGDRVLQQELLDPLSMQDSSYTADAIQAAANHAEGYRWTPHGTIEVPFTQLFPYDFGGAGDINSTIEDMARWVRLQLGNGRFEGRPIPIVSPENLAVTRTPKVGISDKVSYTLGWAIQQTPNGTIVWHNGGTNSFGAYIGIVPDRDVGVIVLTNETNVGMPDAVGLWTLDRLLGNPEADHMADRLKAAKATFETAAQLFAKPANPRPFPPLAPLAGGFSHPSMGKAAVVLEGEALVMEFPATGAKLTLEPWNGEVFTAKLLPIGRFAAVADNLGPLPNGFVQFQIDKDAKLNRLRLSFDDGQAYEFTRE
jgi:CubicO group peptidase (beta-lactamase class C family)